MKRTLSLSLLLLNGALCTAQQGFPLKPGDWEATTAVPGMDEPMVMHFCLTDAEWTRALTQNPTCKIEQFNVTSKGATYAMNCNMKSAQMKGAIELKFDGMEHMTGTGNITMVMNGKSTQSTTVTEYRWKTSQCSANDMNLRKRNGK
jgi:hypothetical protein